MVYFDVLNFNMVHITFSNFSTISHLLEEMFPTLSQKNVFVVIILKSRSAILLKWIFVYPVI